MIFFISNQAVCWASGDPHYHTFDGYHYQLHGSCDYVLSRATSGEFAVIATNMPCGAEGSTCTKVVAVHAWNTIVRLARGAHVFVNGMQLADLDREGQSVDGFTIENIGLFVRVLVQDVGVTVLWDGGKFA